MQMHANERPIGYKFGLLSDLEAYPLLTDDELKDIFRREQINIISSLNCVFYSKSWIGA